MSTQRTTNTHDMQFKVSLVNRKCLVGCCKIDLSFSEFSSAWTSTPLSVHHYLFNQLNYLCTYLYLEWVGLKWKLELKTIYRSALDLSFRSANIKSCFSALKVETDLSFLIERLLSTLNPLKYEVLFGTGDISTQVTDGWVCWESPSSCVCTFYTQHTFLYCDI